MPKGVYPRPSLSERFWCKVDRSDSCWMWTASVFASGLPYGQFQTNGRPYVAHRVAWELERGPIPDGTRVLHRCDEPRCVNPDHLFLGTNRDNMKDMASKGRGRLQRPFDRAVGERHGRSKLNSNQVREIRLRAAAGETQTGLGRHFGVSQQTVWDIVSRRRWKHIT